MWEKVLKKCLKCEKSKKFPRILRVAEKLPSNLLLSLNTSPDSKFSIFLLEIDACFHMFSLR